MKKIGFLLLLFISFGCTKSVDSDTQVLVKIYSGTPKAERDTIVSVLEKIYGVKTTVKDNCTLYDKAFVQLKSPRYRADSIIKFQNKERIGTIDYVFGLTSKDISTTKKESSGNIKKPEYKYADWGIMGLAYCPGRSCIVSTFRIQNNDKALYFNRLKKVTVHEFGHNLGLPHCPDESCVMTDAVESIATVDKAKLALCKKCSEKIN